MLLRGSTHVALALDDNRVIGFTNALSDRCPVRLHPSPRGTAALRARSPLY